MNGQNEDRVGTTEFLDRTSPIYHRSPPPPAVSSPKKSPRTMIPPQYYAAAQLQAAQRRVHDGIQAVPTLKPDGPVGQPDGYFNDVVDLSRYLTSSDLPATPREFFDDLFHEKAASNNDNNNTLNKPLSGVIKVKEEPESTATSRCSTPESLLPEHDFDNGEFPTPKFQQGGAEPTTKEKRDGGNLMYQLQSIQQQQQTSLPLQPSSNPNTDADSSGSQSEVEMDMESLDINAKNLKAALAQFKQTSREGVSEGGMTTMVDGAPTQVPPLQQQQQQQQQHKSALKSPRSKTRKTIAKGTDEYVVKRERNNVAVRKSRTKAKLKHIETQMRVGELTEENEQLRNRVASLQKELNALKSFISYNCPSDVKPACFSSTYPPQIFTTKMM